MKKNLNIQQTGAALIVYLLVMLFFISILMIAVYSRLSVAVKRSQTTTDSVAVNYQAESEVYDILERIVKGYIHSPVSINTVTQDGSTKTTVNVHEQNGLQTIAVTVDKPLASSKITGERKLGNAQSLSGVDIILSLDCTGSMGGLANPSDTNSRKTRYGALRDAAISFVQKIDSLPNKDKFHLGITRFGINIEWVKAKDFSGADRDITPTANNGLTNQQIIAALSQIKDTRLDNYSSGGFCSNILDATSVGTPFAFSNEYFKANKKPNGKQIEIVITDGEPNVRIPYAGCNPDAYCSYLPKYCGVAPYGDCMPGLTTNAAGNHPECYGLSNDFLACTMATTNDTVPAYKPYTTTSKPGARDPNVDAYAVVVSSNLSSDVENNFIKYLPQGHYFSYGNANLLTNVLGNIFDDIVAHSEQFTIRKSTPGN